MMTSSQMQVSDPGMPLQSGANGRSARGSGFFGAAAAMLTTLIGVVLFVGALVVITALSLAVLLAALCVVAIRGAVNALTPRHTEHHVDQGKFHPAAVIDATAKVIRSAAPKPRA
jgi:hypothetical protein